MKWEMRVGPWLAEWRTGAEGHVVNGPAVTLDLLQRCVAAGVPDGGGAVFAAGRQQSPGGIQSDGVYLHVGDAKEGFFFLNLFISF